MYGSWSCQPQPRQLTTEPGAALVFNSSSCRPPWGVEAYASQYTLEVAGVALPCSLTSCTHGSCQTIDQGPIDQGPAHRSENWAIELDSHSMPLTNTADRGRNGVTYLIQGIPCSVGNSCTPRITSKLGTKKIAALLFRNRPCEDFG